MASPIHRYLFSPPASPPLALPPADTPSRRSPALDSLAHAVQDFLLPSPRQREHGGGGGGAASPAKQHLQAAQTAQAAAVTAATAAEIEYQRQRAAAIHELGPGGFNSTKPYPSRLGKPSGQLQPTIVVRPPQDMTGGPSSTRHRRVSSTPINVCTATPLTPQSFSVPLPKKVVRALVFLALLVASGWILGAAVGGGVEAPAPDKAEARASMPASDILARWRETDEVAQPAARKYPVVSNRPRGGAPDRIVYDRARRAAVPPSRTQRRRPALAPQHELLALQSYLLASPTHALPAQDAARPLELDAEALLGYALDAQGLEELEREVDPVVVWAGSETWTAPIDRLLELYALDPPPRTLSLAQRGEPEHVAAVLARLVPTRDQASPLPFVVIGGTPIGGYEALLELHQADKLLDLLNASGTVVDGAKVKAEQAALRAKRMRGLKQAVIQRR